MTLTCPCCRGTLEVSSHRHEPTRSQRVIVRHPARRVARPTNALDPLVDAGFERPLFETRTVPEFARTFAIGDMLSLHALGAYTDERLSETTKQIGQRCFEELQGIAQPVAPTHKPAPVAKLSTGFGKDVRRVLV